MKVHSRNGSQSSRPTEGEEVARMTGSGQAKPGHLWEKKRESLSHPQPTLHMLLLRVTVHTPASPKAGVSTCRGGPSSMGALQSGGRDAGVQSGGGQTFPRIGVG